MPHLIAFINKNQYLKRHNKYSKEISKLNPYDSPKFPFLEAVAAMQRRKASHPLDKLGGLMYLCPSLQARGIPIYDRSLDIEQIWATHVTRAKEKKAGEPGELPIQIPGYMQIWSWITTPQSRPGQASPEAFALELLFGWPHCGKGGRWFPTWGELMAAAPSAADVLTFAIEDDALIERQIATLRSAAIAAGRGDGWKTKLLRLSRPEALAWFNCNVTRAVAGYPDVISVAFHGHSKSSTGHQYTIRPATGENSLGATAIPIMLPTIIPDGSYCVFAYPALATKFELDDRLVLCKLLKNPNEDRLVSCK